MPSSLVWTEKLGVGLSLSRDTRTQLTGVASTFCFGVEAQCQAVWNVNLARPWCLILQGFDFNFNDVLHVFPLRSSPLSDFGIRLGFGPCLEKSLHLD